MAKKKRVRVEEILDDDTVPSTSSLTNLETGSWPLPRSVIKEPDQWVKYAPLCELASVSTPVLGSHVLILPRTEVQWAEKGVLGSLGSRKGHNN